MVWSRELTAGNTARGSHGNSTAVATGEQYREL
jgi:hypothetical protein